jgi:hypothetical protein
MSSVSFVTVTGRPFTTVGKLYSFRVPAGTWHVAHGSDTPREYGARIVPSDDQPQSAQPVPDFPLWNSLTIEYPTWA